MIKLILFASISLLLGASCSQAATKAATESETTVTEESPKQDVAAQIKRIKERIDGEAGNAEKRTLLNEGLQIAQKAKDLDSMLYFLRVRFDLLKLDPAVSKKIIYDRTISPALSLGYSSGRKHIADKFADHILKDIEGHPLAEEIQSLVRATKKKFKEPGIGDAVSFNFKEFSTGEEIRLKDYLGQYVLLNFWVSNCDQCLEQKKFIRQALELYKDKGLVVMGFSQDDSDETIRAYLDKLHIDWPQCADAKKEHNFARKLNLYGVPYNILLGPDGLIMALNLRDEALLEKFAEVFKEK